MRYIHNGSGIESHLPSESLCLFLCSLPVTRIYCSDSARGKRIVRYPFLGGCATVVMPSSMCEDGVGESNLTSRNRGRRSTPLQTINRIRYNQQNLSFVISPLSRIIEPSSG